MTFVHDPLTNISNKEHISSRFSSNSEAFWILGFMWAVMLSADSNIQSHTGVLPVNSRLGKNSLREYNSVLQRNITK